MTEEIKNEEETKCCCVCKFIKCENCQKFLIVAFGTFVGMFCAMSLFWTLHKPPMMHRGHYFWEGGPRMEHHWKHHHHHFKGGDNWDRDNFMPRPDFDKQLPPDAQKSEIKD